MRHPLAMFDRVRVINLVDRADRQREATVQIMRAGGFDDGRIAFYPATRPADPGSFSSLGARGCFESHLGLLREARDAGARTLLILEDDLDFSADFETRGRALLGQLAETDWSIFYGAHRKEASGRSGLVRMAPGDDIVTAAFLAFDGAVLAPLIDFLEGLLTRPAGSPDYGPMHVDGAYSIFRMLHPELVTYAAFPPIGHQRASRSDITPTGMLLDRWALTRPLANGLRRVRNRLRGR